MSCKFQLPNSITKPRKEVSIPKCEYINYWKDGANNLNYSMSLAHVDNC